MQSQLGWTFLSQNALAQAEAQLNPDVQGVRDELGFMSLHRAYADRFFPGTSTQQTRLRYILFIPWIFRKVAENYPQSQIRSEIEKEEVILTARLKKASEDGVIGSRTYPRAPSQPASTVYWNALGTWNILMGHIGGSYPNRFQVYRSIRAQPHHWQLKDDDGHPLEEQTRIFTTLPKPPDEWGDSNAPLTFKLTPSEAIFVRDRLIGVFNPVASKPSLLARIVQAGSDVTALSAPWDLAIRKLVDEEEQAILERASQASAMTAIGRAIYAALVEQIRDRQDGLPTERIHRNHLPAVINRHLDNTLALAVPKLIKELPSLPGTLMRLIEETQSWLAKGNYNRVEELRPIYAAVEQRRKGQRARLPATVTARERRAEWLPEEHPQATPLDYRWGVVKRLLGDLRDFSNE